MSRKLFPKHISTIDSQNYYIEQLANNIGAIVDIVPEVRKKKDGLTYRIKLRYPYIRNRPSMESSIGMDIKLEPDSYRFQMLRQNVTGKTIRLWRFDDIGNHEHTGSDSPCHLHLTISNTIELLYPTRYPSIEEIFTEISKTVNNQWSLESCPLIVNETFMKTKDINASGSLHWFPPSIKPPANSNNSTPASTFFVDPELLVNPVEQFKIKQFIAQLKQEMQQRGISEIELPSNWIELIQSHDLDTLSLATLLEAKPTDGFQPT